MHVPDELYVLSAGDYYYPGGGLNDYLGAFGSLEAAKERFQRGGSFFSNGQEVFFDRAFEWGEIAQITAVGLQSVLYYGTGAEWKPSEKRGHP